MLIEQFERRFEKQKGKVEQAKQSGKKKSKKSKGKSAKKVTIQGDGANDSDDSVIAWDSDDMFAVEKILGSRKRGKVSKPGNEYYALSLTYSFCRSVTS